MILRISSLLLLLTILPAAFIYISRLQFMKRVWLRRMFLVPNILLLALLAVFASSDARLNENADMVAVFLVLLFCITVPEAFYAIIYACSFFYKRRRRRRSIRRAAGVAAAAVCALIITAVVACFTTLKVHRHEYVSADLPKAFDGYKIVHLTDLHLGTYRFFPPALRRIVRTVNAENADLVAFTGDLVNYGSDEIPQFRSQLAAMRAKDGVVSVMGNHDYLIYVNFPDDSANIRHISMLQNEERQAGWRLLLNENIVIRRATDSIAIIGSENDGKKPFPSKGDLPKALNGLQSGCFKVLLTHDPTQWRQKVLPLTDIQLTLSGHTHAGQVKILGRSVSELAYKEWHGMYYEGSRAIFVSSGVGEALMPFRIGAWPTVDIITLRSKQQ